ATEAARAIRSTASARSSYGELSVSTNGETGACCWPCASATPRVLGAWLAKESVRDVYLAENVQDATTLLDKAIVGCADDDVAEIQALGRTLASWRAEILAHHDTGASNGPTEVNLLVKKVKRCGHGFTNFEHYRLRVLLHTGGVKWDAPQAAPIRARCPHSNA
ncbi:MAG: transposase, partial [Acidimicrobiia bacterium]